jgi:hypothetical protein
MISRQCVPYRVAYSNFDATLSSNKDIKEKEMNLARSTLVILYCCSLVEIASSGSTNAPQTQPPCIRDTVRLLLSRLKEVSPNADSDETKFSKSQKLLGLRRALSSFPLSSLPLSSLLLSLCTKYALTLTKKTDS